MRLFAILFVFCLFLPVLAPSARAEDGASASSSSDSANPPQGFNPFEYYNYYTPYLFGGQEEQKQEGESKKTRFMPYDPALRGKFEHPATKEYGPGGDQRIQYDRSGDSAIVGAGGAGYSVRGGSSSPFPLPEGVSLSAGEEWSVPRSVLVGIQRVGGQAALSLRAPVLAGSCGKAGPLEYTLEHNAPWLDVRVRGYRVTGMDARGCKSHDQHPSAEILLDRATLGKTSQIRIAIGTDINLYNVKIEGETLAIEPIYTPSAPPLVQGQDTPPLTHEYVKGEIVALFVPAAASDEDVGAQVAAFAARKGLSPVSGGAMSLPAHVAGNRAWYFVDPSGALSRRVSSGPASVGAITRARSVSGPGGTVHESDEIDVYAALPPKM